MRAEKESKDGIKRGIIWSIWAMALILLVVVVIWQVNTCYTTEAYLAELRGEKIHDWCLN